MIKDFISSKERLKICKKNKLKDIHKMIISDAIIFISLMSIYSFYIVYEFSKRGF